MKYAGLCVEIATGQGIRQWSAIPYQEEEEEVVVEVAKMNSSYLLSLSSLLLALLLLLIFIIPRLRRTICLAPVLPLTNKTILAGFSPKIRITIKTKEDPTNSKGRTTKKTKKKIRTRHNVPSARLLATRYFLLFLLLFILPFPLFPAKFSFIFPFPFLLHSSPSPLLPLFILSYMS